MYQAYVKTISTLFLLYLSCVFSTKLERPTISTRINKLIEKQMMLRTLLILLNQFEVLVLYDS
jgi:hypothetical protein